MKCGGEEDGSRTLWSSIDLLLVYKVVVVEKVIIENIIGEMGRGKRGERGEGRGRGERGEGKRGEREERGEGRGDRGQGTGDKGQERDNLILCEERKPSRGFFMKGHSRFVSDDIHVVAHELGISHLLFFSSPSLLHL